MKKDKQRDKQYRDFVADMKAGDFAPCMIFYGQEDYLIKWAMECVIKKYVQAAFSDFDACVLPSEATPSDIIASCETLPLMSEKRVVAACGLKVLDAKGAIKDFSNEGIEAISAYIESPAEGTVLILTNPDINAASEIVKAARKCGKVYEFDKLARGELKVFAERIFKRRGIELPGHLIHMIIDESGYENKDSYYRLLDMQSDIEKIIAHAGGSPITEDDIIGVVSGDSETFIFDLLDGISGNDKRRALEILGNRLAEDPYGDRVISNNIIRQMEQLFAVKQYMEDEGITDNREVGRRMKMHEYRAKILMDYCRRYSRAHLKEMLLGSYEAYENIITGGMDPRTSLELLIAKM